MAETDDVLCYVFVQGNDKDEKTFYDLVSRSKDGEIILYPERAMTFVDTVCYQPFVKPIVTENPYLICCYSRRNVRVLQDGKWVKPSMQTYGASISLITELLLGYHNSISMLPMGGVEAMEKFRDKVKRGETPKQDY